MRRPWIYGVALAAGAAVALPAPARGQSPQAQAAPAQEHLHAFERRPYTGPPFTLEAALAEALERNPALIALRQEFEAARLGPAAERFLMAPTFEAQIWQWPVTAFNPADTNMYMFTIGQEVPGRGKRQLRASVAEKDAEIAANDVAVRARDLVAQVKRAYAELFITRKDIEIHLENVELLRQFTDITHAKYAAGRMSQADVVKAVVELSNVHDHLVAFDERAQLAEAALNALLDRPPESPIGPLAEPRAAVSLPPPAELQRLALENQPELRDAQLRRERGEAELSLARSEYKPDLMVGGGYMLMPRDRDAWTATVGITWPRAPWSRGRLDARVAEAEAGIAAARARERVVENGIRLAVQEAYVRVQAASQRASLLGSSIVPQFAHAIEVARVAYQTDRGDLLSLIDTERSRLDARHNYYMALSNLEQAVADLERVIGADLAAPVQSAASAAAGGGQAQIVSARAREVR